MGRRPKQIFIQRRHTDGQEAKEKTHIYGIQKDGNDNPVCDTAKVTQMYRIIFWTLWEREWVG